MTQQQRIGIIIAVVVAIVAIAGGLWWYFSQDEGTSFFPTTQQGSQQNAGGVNGDGAPVNVDQAPSVEIADSQTRVLRLARAFTERFGTFSNRNEYENITDIQALMTEKLQNDTSKYINADPGREEDEFYGVTTQALTTEMNSFEDESRARVTVGTVRQETRGQERETNEFQQEVVLDIVYQNDQWLVDTVTWK